MGSVGEVSPPSLAGGSTTTGTNTGRSLVSGMGQDPATVPAAAASHCPQQQLCPSQWPRRRGAPSRRSAARGCRQPVTGPHAGWDRAPGPRGGGSPILLPTRYLQSLQEAEGAQAPAPGHDAECGVVQQLLVVEPRMGEGMGVRHSPPCHPGVSQGVLLPPSKAEIPPGNTGPAQGSVSTGQGWRWLRTTPAPQGSGAEMLWMMEGGVCGQKENLWQGQNQIQLQERGQDRTPVPRQCLAFHGVTQLPPPARNKTPCKAQTPEPETAATPVPCPDLLGRISAACPGSVSAGAESRLPAEGQAACPPPQAGLTPWGYESPFCAAGGERGTAAAGSVRPRRKIQY